MGLWRRRVVSDVTSSSSSSSAVSVGVWMPHPPTHALLRQLDCHQRGVNAGFPHARVRTDTDTHTHTHTNTHTNTHTHTRTPIFIHTAHAHAQAHMRAYAATHANIHTHTHTYTHTLSNARARTHTIHTHTHTHPHSYTQHTHARTHAHTHIHTRARTHAQDELRISFTPSGAIAFGGEEREQRSVTMRTDKRLMARFSAADPIRDCTIKRGSFVLPVVPLEPDIVGQCVVALCVVDGWWAEEDELVQLLLPTLLLPLLLAPADTSACIYGCGGWMPGWCCLLYRRCLLFVPTHLLCILRLATT